MAGHPHSTKRSNGRRRPFGKLDFNQSPFLVIWEVTRACDLECVHCRAEAQENRHPLELTTEEGFALLDEIRRFGQPMFVFTGGDPLKRLDIFKLTAYAKKIGLSPGMSPSGTPLLNRDNLQQAAEAGINTVSISIDAPTAETHDEFRRVPGSFELSTRAAKTVRDLGLRLQINTVITTYNVDLLDDMARLVTDLEAARWEVFYLVPTGRGQELERAPAEQYERVSNWLYDQTSKLDTHITAVEAGFYRRVVLERLAEEQGVTPLEVLEQSQSGHGRFLPKMNSGSGFVFISHIGEIYPSGFLPIVAGNVRADSLVDVYRHHPMFQELRNSDKLRGRCGRCEYRTICAGSRARAYGVTGDYLAEDPFCVYEPQPA
ncbi:MAG: putative mycofactocin radical SAM maturase MftC [Anaerolineales bacterium]|nr:putative mycofactocin radical SAM maturase MftC [Anaerolineales bacterium]